MKKACSVFLFFSAFHSIMPMDQLSQTPQTFTIFEDPQSTQPHNSVQNSPHSTISPETTFEQISAPLISNFLNDLDNEERILEKKKAKRILAKQHKKMLRQRWKDLKCGRML